MRANYLLQQLCFSFIQFSFSHYESVQRIETRKKNFFERSSEKSHICLSVDPYILFYFITFSSVPFRPRHGLYDCTGSAE